MQKRVLSDQDNAHIGSLIVSVLAQKGYCLPDPSAVLSRIRVSKKGNVLIDENLYISNDLLVSTGITEPKKLKDLLLTLTDSALEKLKSKLLSAPSVKVNLEPLTINDFLTDVIPYENDQSLKTAVYAFSEIHKKYSEVLRQYGQSLFGGEFPSFICRELAVKRATCRALPEDAAIKKNKWTGAVVIVCRACGFAAVQQPLKRSWEYAKGISLEGDKTYITEGLQIYYADKLKQSGVIEEAERRLEELKNGLQGFVPGPRAVRALSDLEFLVKSLRSLSVVRQGSVFNISGTGLLADAQAVRDRLAFFAAEVANEWKIPEEEARQSLLQSWEAFGRIIWNNFEEKWAVLPVFYKIISGVREAHERLSDFMSDWENGRVSASTGSLRMGREPVNALEEKALSVIADRLLVDFESALKRAVSRYPLPEAAEAAIFLFLEKPKKMGATTAAAVLTGSKSQKVLAEHYDKCSQYGALAKKITQKETQKIIENMLSDDLLAVKTVGWHDLPVLFVLKEIEKYFYIYRQVNKKEREKTPEEKLKLIELAVQKKDWEAVAEMQKEGFFPAEAALRIASVLWPAGKAAKMSRKAVV